MYHNKKIYEQDLFNAASKGGEIDKAIEDVLKFTMDTINFQRYVILKDKKAKHDFLVQLYNQDIYKTHGGEEGFEIDIELQNIEEEKKKAIEIAIEKLKAKKKSDPSIKITQKDVESKITEKIEEKRANLKQQKEDLKNKFTNLKSKEDEASKEIDETLKDIKFATPYWQHKKDVYDKQLEKSIKEKIKLIVINLTEQYADLIANAKDKIKNFEQNFSSQISNLVDSLKSAEEEFKEAQDKHNQELQNFQNKLNDANVNKEDKEKMQSILNFNKAIADINEKITEVFQKGQAYIGLIEQSTPESVQESKYYYYLAKLDIFEELFNDTSSKLIESSGPTKEDIANAKKEYDNSLKELSELKKGLKVPSVSAYNLLAKGNEDQAKDLQNKANKAAESLEDKIEDTKSSLSQEIKQAQSKAKENKKQQESINNNYFENNNILEKEIINESIKYEENLKKLERILNKY